MEKALKRPCCAGAGGCAGRSGARRKTRARPGCAVAKAPARQSQGSTVGGLLGAIGLLGVDAQRDRRWLSSGFGAVQVYGAITALAAINPWSWGLPILLVFAGLSMSVSNTSANSLLQATVAASLFGSLMTGISVSLLGVRYALLIKYWNGLKRGANDVPFWDDVKFSLRSRLGRELMLIDVFESPLRFRFDLIGADLTEWYGGTIGNKFLGEIDLHTPFDELTLQCKATVEGCAPTYYCQTAVREGDAEHPGGYVRLLLPLWGDGRIEMLLGAVVLKGDEKKLWLGTRQGKIVLTVQ